MIHHMSIPAKDPHRVAQVLAELCQGSVMPFPPLEGAYAVAAKDVYGTLFEVYPIGSEIMPGQGQDEASFCQNAHPYHFTAVHAAVSVPVSQAEIEAIAQRQGWRTLVCNRDGLFDLVEFWVENRLMLELLPPQMAEGYLQTMSPANLEHLEAQLAMVPTRS
ncbi:hypothetical protein [Leptolyngbya sp. KIOST-1]|uniref:hypothetical protein n=1 Tax=Leptolyngbya sp. KIOST-1 TaxID=1229172 RepID=UPI00056C9524|nr:hypothetical protein [Leptolyngbya sp. KIOST-1]